MSLETSIIKNSDYKYFIEIDLWRMKNGDSYLYRFAHANESPFWSSFKISQEEEIKLAKKWNRYQRFTAFSSTYQALLGRGYFVVYVSNNTSFPYESQNIAEFPALASNLKLETKSVGNKLLFLVSLYQLPKMEMLYIGSLIHKGTAKILEVFVWNKALQESGEKDHYTFLPCEKNKNVPWYEVYASPFKNDIFYVFTETPKNPYWKINSEGIILPSEDSKDSKTLYDILSKLGPRTLKNPISNIQTNSLPLYDIKNKDTPNYILREKGYTIQSFFLFLFVLLAILFVQILAQKKN